jgi:hypothetical protein
MGRQWCLATLLIVNAQVGAQELPAVSQAPLTPVVMAEEPGKPHIVLGEDGSSNDPLAGNHAFPNFINFMSNPLQSIDPRAVTALYPIFGSSWISTEAPIPSGDAQVYGPAITIALSDRFAFGLNQGGLVDAHFDTHRLKELAALDPLGRFHDIELGGERDGWLNLGGFFQYTLIQDPAEQFLLTGGIRWEAPCGSHEIFQGNGPLELSPYLTAGKEVCEYHVLGTLGYQFPAGPGSNNTQLFYCNVHLDRRCFGWLYPLVEFNCSYHTTSVSFGLPARTDFIDFGNFESSGNIVTVAAGANAVIVSEKLELGAVYTTAIASQHDFGVDGLFVKMTIRY